MLTAEGPASKKNEYTPKRKLEYFYVIVLKSCIKMQACRQRQILAMYDSTGKAYLFQEQSVAHW